MKIFVASLLIMIGMAAGVMLLGAGYLLFTENTTAIYGSILCEAGETMRREERPMRPTQASVHHFCETDTTSRDVTAEASGLAAALIAVPLLLTVLPLNFGVLLMLNQRKRTRNAEKTLNEND